MTKFFEEKLDTEITPRQQEHLLDNQEMMAKIKNQDKTEPIEIAFQKRISKYVGELTAKEIQEQISKGEQMIESTGVFQNKDDIQWQTVQQQYENLSEVMQRATIEGPKHIPENAKTVYYWKSTPLDTFMHRRSQD